MAAAARLHAVALYDGTQLCTARWNLGVLYNLPEARSARFHSFMADRTELRGLYQRLGAELPANGWDSASQNGDLAFRLVESLVNLRADGLNTPDSPQAGGRRRHCPLRPGGQPHCNPGPERGARGPDEFLNFRPLPQGVAAVPWRRLGLMLSMLSMRVAGKLTALKPQHPEEHHD